MSERVLITGGAGFIGSHLADRLIEAGYRVRLLDNLDAQVHPEGAPPAYLHADAELQVGDVRDRAALTRALEGVDAVYHFASLTGTTQSLYRIGAYSDVNVQGTALLLELLAARRERVRKLVLSSSRAVYGEGAYRHPDGRLVYPSPRPAVQLQRGDWEIRDPADGALLTPLPTPETAPAEPGSLYAVQKLAQEQMCRLAGDAYGVPVVCLRFFNVYGPRQSLQNPYTGVIGFFATQLLNDRPVNVYEDGLPSRDFVHVHDVARACQLALETDRADGRTVNIGAGVRLSLLEIAETMTAILGGPPPQVSGQFRVGDVRHCYADLSRARGQLDYTPEVDFAGGIAALLEEIVARGEVWADRSAEAAAELRERGLGGAARR